MRYARLLLAALLLAAASSGCIQYVMKHSPPAPSYGYADSDAAVAQAFADHGPGVVATFQCIKNRESGGNPYARNGKYVGILQIDSTNAGYIGSMEAAAATLGRAPDWFDPYVNARTGRIIYDRRLELGLNPLSPWSTAPGCV